MNTLETAINGFNVISTYTHIDASNILDDNYKVDFRMLRPKLSVQLRYKGRTIIKEYTLSAHDLGKNVKIGNSIKKRDVLYIKDDSNIIYHDSAPGKRKNIYLNAYSKSPVTRDELRFIYKPTQEDLHYILRNIISDYMMIYEYNLDEFIEMFMTKCDIEKLRESEKVYNDLNYEIIQMGLNENLLANTLDRLSKMGVE